MRYAALPDTLNIGSEWGYCNAIGQLTGLNVLVLMKRKKSADKKSLLETFSFLTLQKSSLVEEVYFAEDLNIQ